VDDFAAYASDVATVMALARSREPGLPRFLLGHSAGGLVACIYALDHPTELAGLIIESAAFDFVVPGFLLQPVVWLSHLAPRLPFITLPQRFCTRDREARRRLREDPLIRNEWQPLGTMAAMVRARARVKRESPSITAPVLILHGTGDWLTRVKGSRRFHDAVGSRDKTLRLYEGHYHDLLNDLGKDEVMADIARWIGAHLPVGPT
jgi:alpha-beta hydrolase superfamily lysophospholipase